MSEFKCTQCGACCMKIGMMLQAIDKKGTPKHINEELKKFPYSADINGACEKLVNNECTVYDNRPNICSVEYMYDTYLKDTMTGEQHSQYMKACCNSLIKSANLSNEFLIK